MSLWADDLRPQDLEQFVGQEHLTAQGAPLRTAVEKKSRFSFILWGPPGTGKTTLARIYARALDARLYELSAVSAGKQDIKKILGDKTGGDRVLFLDEIHRFNKAQQDFLLPYVETGELILIGATTENPSFEVITPLLSRLQVFTLKKLTADDLRTVMERTGLELETELQERLAQAADGDARRVLTLMQAAYDLYGKVTLDTLEQAAQNGFLRYDKFGDQHYDLISAYIKSLRASQPDAALYYLARMVEAGEDPKFIARRMVIFASEDVGVAQPTALVVANEVFKAVEIIGLPEAAINLAHGTAYLVRAAKDRSAYDAYQQAVQDVRNYGSLEVPLKLRNPVTDLMEREGYGQGYEKYDSEDLRPEQLRDKKYLDDK